ncbi:xanthine dehydrogenase accessory protein XdhC [Endozoicomonas sp. SCSIO W0465]|uniref:xanthine dehydrogenase accessory protein XdhC n=1 Tax=Endozoicomonas sp. SCSIO W0465 TaxID=2918516 RepID=UPI002075F0EC|nr:xanthine dehydrogenase accessory protein XdhC [Endozoicomonas sp. SCSIO W0465]USE35824.1 xanthine dehydrogenase accessory protein XdhC [Endozoicomonas sp. SCSIO W0465]
MWIDALANLQKTGELGVLITILGSAGSAPRKSGSKMVVTADQCFDTIGGGQLEFLLIQKARELLLGNHSEPVLEYFPLGPRLGQCCGGSVSALLEPVTTCGFRIALFGAGHVGHALVNVLAPLDCQITWIDSRAERFPDAIPGNVQVCISDRPELEVENLQEDTFVLVVTHNHQLDFAITEATLKHDNSRWLGVIGSETKAKRFRQRLEHRGCFSSADIEQMRCPVGLNNVGGRKPAEIAISIAAEILSIHNGSRDEKNKKREGIPWQDLKKSLYSHEHEAAQ